MSNASSVYYKILVLPNGEKKYISYTNKKNNPGHPGYSGLGFVKCDKCGQNHDTAGGCVLYWYYDVTEYTRDEFLALAKRSQPDEEELQALKILNGK